MASKEVSVNMTDRELTASTITSFVQQATVFPGSIRVGKNGKMVDGKSVLGVLTLGIQSGDVLVLEVDGPGADGELEKLELFFA